MMKYMSSNVEVCLGMFRLSLDGFGSIKMGFLSDFRSLGRHTDFWVDTQAFGSTHTEGFSEKLSSASYEPTRKGHGSAHTVLRKMQN